MSLQFSDKSSTELFHPLLAMTKMTQVELIKNRQGKQISPRAEGLCLSFHEQAEAAWQVIWTNTEQKMENSAEGNTWVRFLTKTKF